MSRVGFIGVGSQGGPMARRIVERGYPLTIWARRPVPRAVRRHGRGRGVDAGRAGGGK